MKLERKIYGPLVKMVLLRLYLRFPTCLLDKTLPLAGNKTFSLAEAQVDQHHIQCDEDDVQDLKTLDSSHFCLESSNAYNACQK